MAKFEAAMRDSEALFKAGTTRCSLLSTAALDKPAVLCTLFGLNAWSTPPKNFYVMIYDIKFTLILIGTLLMLAMILHDDF